MLSNGFLESTDCNTEAMVGLMKEDLVEAAAMPNGDKVFILSGHGWYLWHEVREMLLGETQGESMITQKVAMEGLKRILESD